MRCHAVRAPARSSPAPADRPACHDLPIAQGHRRCTFTLSRRTSLALTDTLTTLTHRSTSAPSAGTTPIADAFAPYAAEHVAARVSRVDRGACDALAADGPLRADLLRRAARRPAPPTRSRTPCVGDWVAVRAWSDGRVTAEAVLPRRTAFVRAARHARHLARPGTRRQRRPRGRRRGAAPGTRPRPDRAVPRAGLGERRHPDGRADQGRPGARRRRSCAPTSRPPPPASTCWRSARPPARAWTRSASTSLPGRTLALLGPSGAGKSTLTNALSGEVVMFTRELRADGKGRHTTVHRELVLLPGGGLVVDTPGLRSVGLTDVSESLDLVFADVEALAAQCRFADCAHEHRARLRGAGRARLRRAAGAALGELRQAAARGPLDGDAARRPAARRGALEVEAHHQGVPQPPRQQALTRRATAL